MPDVITLIKWEIVRMLYNLATFHFCRQNCWKTSKSPIFVTRASKTKKKLLASSVQFRRFLINPDSQVQTNVIISRNTWHLRGVVQLRSSILVTKWKKERRWDEEGVRHLLLKAQKLVCHRSFNAHIAYTNCAQKKIKTKKALDRIKKIPKLR